MRKKQNRAQEAKARAARVLALNEQLTRTRSTAVAGLVAPESDDRAVRNDDREPAGVPCVSMDLSYLRAHQQRSSGTPRSAAQRSRDLRRARCMESPHPTTPSQTRVANDVSTNSGESPGTPAQTEARTRRVRKPPLAGFLRAHGQLQGNDEQESEPLPRPVDEVGAGDIPQNWRATYDLHGNFTLEMISPVAAAPNAVPEHGLLSFPMSRPAVEQVQAHLAAVRAATTPATERAGVRADRSPAQRQRGQCPPSTPPQTAPPQSRTPVHGVIATVNDGRIGRGREMGTETGTRVEIEVPSPEMIAAMQHALLADALTPRRSRASFRGGTHLEDVVDIASRRVPTNLELRAQEHRARGSDSQVLRSDSAVQSMEDELIAADLQASCFLLPPPPHLPSLSLDRSLSNEVPDGGLDESNAFNSWPTRRGCSCRKKGRHPLLVSSNLSAEMRDPQPLRHLCRTPPSCRLQGLVLQAWALYHRQHLKLLDGIGKISPTRVCYSLTRV